MCSEKLDHTSVLQFLEQWTGVREPNISEWRRKTFGDMTSVFRFENAERKPPMLPDTSGPLALAKFSSANLPKPVLPGGQQSPPNQEQGERKRVSEKDA